MAGGTLNFDSVGNSLAAITPQDGNTVGSYIRNMYGTNSSDPSIIDKALNASSAPRSSTIDPGKQAAIDTLGSSFYSSAPHIAAQYTQLGKFFSGGEPGNLYTNRYEKPQEGAPLTAETPTKFQNSWFESMRDFSRAQEVADRGQSQVRGS